MPLFLARGQPDRLQDRGQISKHDSMVKYGTCFLWLEAAVVWICTITVPSVGGIVSSDVSRSIAARSRTPEVHM